MSDQLFNEVGTAPPFDGALLGGVTVLQLRNTLDGADRLKGEVMRLVAPTGRNTSADIQQSDSFLLAYTDLISPNAVGASNISAVLQTAVFGCLLEDIADGEKGLVMIRGTCMAYLQASSGFAIGNALSGVLAADDSLFVGGSAGGVRYLNTVQNLGANVTAKVIAKARLGTGNTVAVGPTAVLRPVFFNGCEGFGMHRGN